MSISDVTKNRGRPVTTGKGIPMTLRLQPGDLGLLDLWIATNAPESSRPEAMRRILRMVAMRGPKPEKPDAPR